MINHAPAEKNIALGVSDVRFYKNAFQDLTLLSFEAKTSCSDRRDQRGETNLMVIQRGTPE